MRAAITKFIQCPILYFPSVRIYPMRWRGTPERRLRPQPARIINRKSHQAPATFLYKLLVEDTK